MARHIALMAVLVAIALPPAAVFAQGDPFTPLPQAPLPAPPPAPVPGGGGSAADDGGLSGWQTALIFIAGGALLLGIGLAIVADARQKAPAATSTPADSARQERDPHRERGKQQARRKQKAARAQRRRNR